jgi:hypothetical protein
VQQVIRIPHELFVTHHRDLLPSFRYHPLSGPAHRVGGTATASGRLRPYARPRRPISALWSNNAPAQLLIVTDPEIMYAYGDFRWGCIRRITWWINRGYRLDRHPGSRPNCWTDRP